MDELACGKTVANHPTPKPILLEVVACARPYRDVLRDYIHFQNVCSSLDVPSGDLVSLEDIREGKGVHRLASCFWTLASNARRAGREVRCGVDK